MITEAFTAKALSALGHEHRLSVYRLLVRAGPEGLSVGDIGRNIGIPASTLAHHLSALVDAGLVQQERQGRSIVNQADFATMNAIVTFLTAECCAGVEQAAEEAIS